MPYTEISIPKLNGEWIGRYRGTFDQVVSFHVSPDNVLVATKITGDEHVPGGEVTFMADLNTMSGTGQVAEKEFRNNCWIPGKLFIDSQERVRFTYNDLGTVEFRKDD